MIKGPSPVLAYDSETDSRELLPNEKPPVLLVDDDERNLLALAQILGEVSEVVTATSGRDALRHLLNRDFAAILLDVYMPEMDGYEVASLIRAREHTARIPIIFLSAVNKDAEHLMRGYAMGAVDYVFKPVDAVVLRSKVGVFADLFRMRREVEARSRSEQALREAGYQAELERLRMQRELDESRARQAAIIHSMPIILYMEGANCSPRIPKFVGGNFEGVLGFPFEQLESEPGLWADRLHPDDRDEAIQALEDRRRTGLMAAEYRWRCADGNYKYFLDQSVCLQDGGGEDVDFVGTLIDVTERKLLQAQLLQAGKLDAIGQLTGGIAHDFNNLLAAILGGITLLERRVTFGPREAAVVQHMRHAANSGAELVSRMMAFARKQDLRPKCVSPAQICGSVAGLVQHTLGGTIVLRWTCDQASRNFFIDEAQLELSLINLVINARDAMPNGGHIELIVEDAEPDGLAGLKPGDYLRIRVKDEGTGIPDELIDRIVEPFFTTKDLGKGTGLGLSMVAGFAQQSGGLLKIDSQLGAGTQIELLLPATRENVALPHEQAVAPDAKAAGRRRSVLLVDDDATVRHIVMEQLNELGLDVFAAPDGQAALQILEQNGEKIDVLLTDFAMPGMNGVETIDHALGRAPGIQCILMTGYADVAGLKSSRARAILRKPIAFADLEAAFSALSSASLAVDDAN